MLASNPQFPFYVFNRRSRQSLFWEEFPADDDGSSSSALELVPLERHDDMITRISEAAARIAREASESGCNVAKMLIEIDKRTVIPHHKFEVVRILTHNYDYDDDGDADRDRDGDEDEPELNSAIEESFAESSMAFGSVPAAKSVVEALEKFKYEGSCDQDHEDESKLIEACVICMEEVMIGSHLTRMPCSHVFHEDCISHWLHQTRTCPICRFKLPS